METTPESEFNRLYEREYRVVHAFLLAHTSDREAASDLLQETFTQVWKHIAQAETIPPERQRFWILAIARNQIRDHHRRIATRNRAEIALKNTLESAKNDQNPAQIVQKTAQNERFLAAISALPEALRVVLTLCIVGEMTSAEVGATLNRPAGTVRYQLSQARALLAKTLSQEEI